MTADPLLDQGELRRALKQYRLPPLERFGQHFLVDADVLQSIIAAAETHPTIPVIEIGAGLGVLTRALAQQRQEAVGSRQSGTAALIAVEFDRRLIPHLIDHVRAFPSVHIVQTDILKTTAEQLLTTAHCRLPTAYDVVGNIPYNITAPILRRFLGAPPRPRRLTLLVDDAVAAAIAATPPDMSVRTISVQVYADVHIARRRIPPPAFVPPPAVHSAVIVLTTRVKPQVTPEQEKAFFRLVRAGFSQRRKTLANALAATERIEPRAAAARLARARLDPRRRAETLTIDEWKRLLGVWNENLGVY